MRNKILISISILLAIIVGTSFLKDEELTIAVLLPVTGDASIYGESARNAAVLASEVLPKHVKVVIEDTNLKGPQTISSYKKVASQHSVGAAISFSSGETVALCQATEKDQVLLLSSGSSPAISNCGPNTYSNFPSDIYQGTILAHHVNQKQVAVIYIQNEYGTGVFNQFKKEYAGEILELPHLPRTTDYRDSILKLKKSNIQNVVLISQPKEASIFLKQASSMNIALNSIYATESLKDESVIKDIPNVYLPIFTVLSPKTYAGLAHDEFVKKYVSMFNTKPTTYADYVYDNVILAGKIADACKTDVDCSRSYLQHMNISGATGAIYFGDSHSVQNKEYTFYSILGDKFTEKAI